LDEYLGSTSPIQGHASVPYTHEVKGWRSHGGRQKAERSVGARAVKLGRGAFMVARRWMPADAGSLMNRQQPHHPRATIKAHPASTQPPSPLQILMGFSFTSCL